MCRFPKFVIFFNQNLVTVRCVLCMLIVCVLLLMPCIFFLFSCYFIFYLISSIYLQCLYYFVFLFKFVTILRISLSLYYFDLNLFHFSFSFYLKVSFLTLSILGFSSTFLKNFHCVSIVKNFAFFVSMSKISFRSVLWM